MATMICVHAFVARGWRGGDRWEACPPGLRRARVWSVRLGISVVRSGNMPECE
jgi:hypothetical protein